jgi:ribosomal protein S18 acetylase RimI-like enzyme
MSFGQCRPGKFKIFFAGLSFLIEEANMEIVELNPQRKHDAVEVIVAAFFDYPMFELYFPDRSKRKRVMTWYLGRVLDTALAYGEVLTTPEISGVIFILPPGHTKISQVEYIRQGFLPAPFVLGIKDFVRSQLLESFVADEHERLMKGRTHYYLWGLTVDPFHKREGIGSALLSPLVEKADSQGLPIYLETHDPKNVNYYQRMNFKLLKTVNLPRTEVPLFCMVREPIAK